MGLRPVAAAMADKREITVNQKADSLIEGFCLGKDHAIGHAVAHDMLDGIDRRHIAEQRRNDEVKRCIAQGLCQAAHDRAAKAIDLLVGFEH